MMDDICVMMFVGLKIHADEVSKGYHSIRKKYTRMHRCFMFLTQASATIEPIIIFMNT